MASVGRQLERVAVDVDVVTAFVVPVRDLRGRIAQRLPDPLLDFSHGGALRDGAKDRPHSRASRQRGPQQTGEEEEAHRREGRDQSDRHDDVPHARERRDDEPHAQQHEAQRAGEVDRAQDAA